MTIKNIALLAFFSIVAVEAAPATTWEKTKVEDGITIYQKAIPGTNVVAFKGVTLIDATVAKLVAILEDTSRKKEWVARLEEAREVAKFSKTERVEYNHTSVPWPLQNRDFVFKTTAIIQKNPLQMKVLIESLSHPEVPEYSGLVRGELRNSSYTFIPLDGGKKTQVTVEIQADPKGSVPKSLVNFFQEEWPINTLKGIRKQAEKNDIQDHPDVAAFFNEEIGKHPERVLASPSDSSKK